MSAAYTPGPWTFSKDDQFGDTRFYVAQQEGAPYTPHYSDVATVIAETCVGDRLAIQQANARLIAAAPEMLEALKVALAMILEECADPEHTYQVDVITKAMAKATGESPW